MQTMTKLTMAIAAWACASAGWAQSEPAANDFDVYRIALTAGEQSAYGVSLDGDWALGEAMRWRLGAGYLHVDDRTDALNVRQARAGVERGFGSASFTLESDYRNDNNIIETALLRLRGDWRGDGLSIGGAIARRRIDVTYDVGSLLSQYVDATQRTYNNELGARVRYAPNDFAVYVSGAYYDYDTDVDRLEARLDTPRLPPGQRPLLQQQLQAFRQQLGRANSRSLRLAGHLLDYSATAGFDYQAGDHLLNAEYVREREWLTGAEVDTVEAGWIMPLSAADVEIRLGRSRIAGQDATFYGGVSLSLYR